MSPWADLTLSGESITGKAAIDPALTQKVSTDEPSTTRPPATERRTWSARSSPT